MNPTFFRLQRFIATDGFEVDQTLFFNINSGLKLDSHPQNKLFYLL